MSPPSEQKPSPCYDRPHLIKSGHLLPIPKPLSSLSLFPSILPFAPLLTPLHPQWPPCVLRAPIAHQVLDEAQTPIFLRSYGFQGEQRFCRAVCGLHAHEPVLLNMSSLHGASPKQ